jgi:hypothetical protein
MSIETRIFYLCYRVDLSVTQDFFVKIGGKRIVFNLEPILNFTNLLNRTWEFLKELQLQIF